MKSKKLLSSVLAALLAASALAVNTAAADGEAADTTPVDYYHEVTHMNPMEDETDTNVKGITRIIGQQAFVMIDNASATINVGSTG